MKKGHFVFLYGQKVVSNLANSASFSGNENKEINFVAGADLAGASTAGKGGIEQQYNLAVRLWWPRGGPSLPRSLQIKEASWTISALSLIHCSTLVFVGRCAVCEKIRRVEAWSAHVGAGGLEQLHCTQLPWLACMRLAWILHWRHWDVTTQNWHIRSVWSAEKKTSVWFNFLLIQGDYKSVIFRIIKTSSFLIKIPHFGKIDKNVRILANVDTINISWCRRQHLQTFHQQNISR